MEELNKYLFQPKKLEDIINTATIVVDTNVLLAAYQYRDVTFKELLHTLENLNNENRLIIPSQVIKEFFKNRPMRIVEIIQKVDQLRNGLPNIDKKVEKIENAVPGMDFLENHSSMQSKQTDFIETEKNFKETKKEYHKELGELLTELRGFFTRDPILEKYEKIFRDAAFLPETLKTEEQLSANFKERLKTNLPPGNKDAAKDSNSEGDYIIWEHILNVENTDVIFVSADNKNDWVYTDSYKKILGARRELIEEFYEASNGHSFSIVHPSTFIASFNPNVEAEVIEDMDTKLLNIAYDLGSSNASLTFNNKDFTRPYKRYYNKTKSISRDFPTQHTMKLENLYNTPGSQYLKNVLSDALDREEIDNETLNEVLERFESIKSNSNLSSNNKDELYIRLAIALKDEKL